MRRARRQPRKIRDRVGPDLVPDGIDPRLFDVLHVAQEVALRASEVHLHLFMVQVHLVLHAMRRAPQALRLEETVAEHLREDVVVVALGAQLGIGEFSRRHGRTGGDECRIGLGRGGGSGRGSRGPRAAAALREQDRAQVRPNVVTLRLLEGSEELRRPGQSADRVVRLVAAEAQNRCAEQLRHGVVVALVRVLQIRRRRLGVDVVLQRVRRVLRVRRVGVAPRGRGAEDVLHHHHRPVAACGCRPRNLAAGDWHCNALARGGDGHRRDCIGTNRLAERLARLHPKSLADAERLHAQLGLLLGEVAAGEPAGIADVVHDPHLHVALLGLQRELLEEGEVLRRQVGCRHAAAGLHRHRMEAQALHGVQVVRQALDGHRAIHPEVWLRPILRRRRLPRQLHLGRGRHLHLLEGILRDGRRTLRDDRRMLR